MSGLSNRPDNSLFLRQDYVDFVYKQAAGQLSMESLDAALTDMGVARLLDMVPSTPALQASIQSNTASQVQDTVTNNLVGANLSRTYLNSDTVALSLGTVVYISGVNTIARADKDVQDSALKVIGLVGQPSIPMSVYGSVIEAGLFKNVLTGATPNTLYYLSNGGAITTTKPSSGQIIVVGWAKNATDLFVKITTLAGLADVLDANNFMFGASNFLTYAYPAGLGTDPLPWYQLFINLALEDDAGFQGGVNH